MHNEIAHLEPEELKFFLQKHPDSLLLDIRESFELNTGKIYWHNWKHIPFGQLLLAFTTLPTHVPVIIYCEHASRSFMAVQYLVSVLPKGQFINLRGGFSHYILMPEELILKED